MSLLDPGPLRVGVRLINEHDGYVWRPLTIITGGRSSSAAAARRRNALAIARRILRTLLDLLKSLIATAINCDFANILGFRQYANQQK